MAGVVKAPVATLPHAMTTEINLPDVLREVSAVFARYEDALVHNNVDVLDELFWHVDAAVRYGAGENLVGIDAIRAFRAARPSAGLARTLAPHRDHDLRRATSRPR